MNQHLLIGGVAFLSAFVGQLLGLLLSLCTSRLGRRFDGCLSGFTGGLLIAFICFEILEEGFMATSLPVAVLGILSGVLLTVYLDGVLARSKRAATKSSLLLALGVVLHNFPEGIALGSLCALSLREGLLLALIISIHCIPEALAIFLAHRQQSGRVFASLAFTVLLALPMMLGGLLGGLLTEISPIFLGLSLTFAGGVMLYITCGEILPASKQLWQGRLTTICAMVGFILGVVITA